METIELADGGLLIYDHAFLPPDVASQYFIHLRDQSQWERMANSSDSTHRREIALHSDDGVTYRDSEIVHDALPWTPELLEIKARVEAIHGKYNYCILNRYESGSECLSWRAANQPGIGNVIGCISLGATRRFRIRHNIKKNPRSFVLGNGTLIIMAGTMQQFWQHEIQKSKENIGERINLTFQSIEKPGTPTL